MDRILITGGAGFIGFHLAKYLADQGHSILVCDNLFRGQYDPCLEQLCSRPNVQFRNVDLANAKNLCTLENSFDLIFHFAAINGTRYFYEMPIQVLEVNILSCLEILHLASRVKPRHVIFASSSEAYAGAVKEFNVPVPTTEEVPLCIDNILNVRNSYAASKIAGEALVVAFTRSRKLPCTIVRFHNVYGPRMGCEHVVPELILRIARGDDPLVIKGASQTRAFCYVEDAVAACVKLAYLGANDLEIFNVGNDLEEITIMNLAELILQLMGTARKIVREEPPAGSVDHRCPDLHKLRIRTGFAPSFQLRQGLEITLNWYLNWLSGNGQREIQARRS